MKKYSSLGTLHELQAFPYAYLKEGSLLKVFPKRWQTANLLEGYKQVFPQIELAQ